MTDLRQGYYRKDDQPLFLQNNFLAGDYQRAPVRQFTGFAPVAGSDHYLVHYGRIGGRWAITRFWADEGYQESALFRNMATNESVLIVL